MNLTIRPISCKQRVNSTTHSKSTKYYSNKVQRAQRKQVLNSEEHKTLHSFLSDLWEKFHYYGQFSSKTVEQFLKQDRETTLSDIRTLIGSLIQSIEQPKQYESMGDEATISIVNLSQRTKKKLAELMKLLADQKISVGDLGALKQKYLEENGFSSTLNRETE